MTICFIPFWSLFVYSHTFPCNNALNICFVVNILVIVTFTQVFKGKMCNKKYGFKGTFVKKNIGPTEASRDHEEDNTPLRSIRQIWQFAPHHNFV